MTHTLKKWLKLYYTRNLMSTIGWSSDGEQLLKNWSRQISINANQCRKQGGFYQKWYYGLGVILIIGETGALSTLINVIVTESENPAILIFVAAVEFLLLVIHGVDKFFNFGSGSEKFFEAAKDYESLSRLVDSTLMLPRELRDDARQVFLSIQKQFTKIQHNGPNLSANSMIHRLDMHIYENPPPQDDTVVEIPEYLTNAMQFSTATQMHEEKHIVNIKNDRDKSIFKNFLYQWRRLTLHEEE